MAVTYRTISYTAFLTIGYIQPFCSTSLSRLPSNHGGYHRMSCSLPHSAFSPSGYRTGFTWNVDSTGGHKTEGCFDFGNGCFVLKFANYLQCKISGAVWGCLFIYLYIIIYLVLLFFLYYFLGGEHSECSC